MQLNSHAFVLAVPATLALADVGASVGATPMHYAAVGAVLVAIATVVKGYDWALNKVDGKMKTAITAAFEIHNAQDETRFERLRMEFREMLSKRPCITCDP